MSNPHSLSAAALRRAATSFVLLLAALLSGCADGAGLNTVERMMWSTYPLASKRGMGTSFIVSCRAPGLPGGKMNVVVSSMHVLDTVGRGPLLFGARVPDEFGEPQVAILQVQHRRRGAPFFVRHPRQDLAAFALHMPPEMSGVVGVGSFLDERSFAAGAPLRAGSEVSFLGFPEVLPGTAGAFPILRTGRVASYPLDTTAADGMFLVNADVYPGDSGAPVFATGTRGKPRLAGMIIRRVGTNERSFSHLAIAVDAQAIRETVQLAVARELQNPDSNSAPSAHPKRSR